MRALDVDVRQYGEPEGIEENIRYSLSLGLPEFQPIPLAHDGTVCIIGSGPSLGGQVDSIRKEREQNHPLIAVNGAHDFLCGHGMIPEVFLTVDPRGMPHNFKCVNDETTYMLASRASQEDFKLLEGKKILLWHSWSTEDSLKLLQGKVCVGGGTTSGLRAINVAYLMGFRNFHLYGMDSCLGEKGEKRLGEDPLPKNVSRTDVIVGGRRFYCNMAMAAQAQEFQELYSVMPDLHVEVFGGGLLSAILEERRKCGYSV